MRCIKCHDRGVVRLRAYCDCDTGQRVLGLDRIRERLMAIWSPRYIDFWFRTPNQAMGSLRPVDLVAQGRVEDVLEAIERLPGLPQQTGVPDAAAAPTGRETTGPAPLQTIPDPPDAVRRVLATKFRRSGQFKLAHALEIGSTQDLTAAERVALEAAVQGQSPAAAGF